MADRLTNCTACDGRGYFRCECWPGDCICGWDDQDCEECGGEGIIDNFYADEFYPIRDANASCPYPCGPTQGGAEGQENNAVRNDLGETAGSHDDVPLKNWGESSLTHSDGARNNGHRSDHDTPILQDVESCTAIVASGASAIRNMGGAG